MKKLLFMAIMATGLSFVSCTAETESIEPIQNLEINQDVDENLLYRVADSIGNSTDPNEGEPIIKKDRD